MEDERDRQSGGDAAQQKTPRPECEESRPLSVEVRLLARGCLARSLAPLVPVRASTPCSREEGEREVPSENAA